MLNILVVVLMSLGVLFFFGSVVGVLRFPDFFTRMHASTKGDTLSSLCLIGGFVLYALAESHSHSYLLCLKLIVILVFMFISTPTASHALAEAAFLSGAKPWMNENKNQEVDLGDEGEEDEQ